MEISYYKFPNRIFLNSEDGIKLTKKIGMACNSSIPKRLLLDDRYPKLCPFFDQISNEDLAAEVNSSFTVHHFFNGLSLSSEELATLKEQLMAYASDNLVKINAFLDSPYLSMYQTDEVSFVKLQTNSDKISFFHSSGDVGHNVHCKHWWNAWTLHGILLCKPC